MKIEAVTVSINFSDYLEKCIPNMKFLDRWIIVTHESDTKTIEICKSYNLEYIKSRRIYEDGAPFAKGKAVNEGLNHLDRNGWLLQLDSDILLPDNFREVIEKDKLINNTLYWSKRYFKDGSVFENIIKVGSLTILGFFQLWHSSVKKTYPEYSNTASFDDMTFKQYFLYIKHLSTKELPLKCIDVSEIHSRFHKGRKQI